MALYDGQYSRVEARLNDWLNATSSSVSGGDLACDLCNRAQEFIWNKADWEPLKKRIAIPYDPATKQVTLPVDCGKIINVYFDAIGYGKPTGYYTKDGQLQYGYKITYPMVAATGFSPAVLTFYYTLPYIPQLEYKASLARFVPTIYNGAGAVTNPQATFFPENLLLRAAQLEHVKDNPFGKGEYNVANDAFLLELWDYRTQVQGVNADFRTEVRDDSGNLVRIQSMDMNGNVITPKAFSPSFDVRWAN